MAVPEKKIDGLDWTITREEFGASVKDARRDGFWEGVILGVLLGAMGPATACGLLPDHLRDALRQSAQTDGEPVAP